MDFTVIGKDGWLFAVFDDVQHLDVNLMRNVTRVINDGIAIMKRAGIETVVALTPAKARVYRDALPADFEFSAAADKRYSMALDLLRAPGTLVPDLAKVLLDQRKAHPEEGYFLKADSHWTAAGAEVAAAEVAKQIMARLRLPPSARPGTQFGGLVTMRQGKNDLSEALPDAFASKYPSQTYRMREVRHDGGASALVEEDNSDALLVGNSFMQPKYGFAAVLSNQLERPVSLVWKVHQSSPYRTLLGALASEQFRRKRPKLLVWDFEETDMVAPTDQAGAWGPNIMSAQSFLTELRTVVGG